MERKLTTEGTEVTEKAVVDVFVLRASQGSPLQPAYMLELDSLVGPAEKALADVLILRAA